MTNAMNKDGVEAWRSTANQVDVRVFANSVGETVVFTHDWCEKGGKYKDPPIELPAKKPEWQLTYQLYDFTGESLQFLTNTNGTAEDAIWVRKGKACPTTKGNGDNQIEFGTCTGDSLTILDVNDGDPCTLTYMLRFEGANGSYRYDPEIKNGGTNRM